MGVLRHPSAIRTRNRIIATEHPDVIRTMDAAYEKCEMKSSLLENENAVGPDTPPFQALYRKQFGG